MTSFPPAPSVLVFSDLDGTLLDHHSYDWRPALPAFDRLRDIGAGLVLASSKTSVEMAQLRRDMGWEDWPAIVENGAGILEPGGTPVVTGSDYLRIRATLDALPSDIAQPFRGFADMSVDEVSRHTGLPPDDAQRAKARAFSEPGLWDGDDDSQQAFLKTLEAQGIFARRGGRFLTLSLGRTKADAMQTLVSRFTPKFTIALGDAPNDTEMLERADIGIIIENPDARPFPVLAGEATGTIRRAAKPGPEGWCLAVSQAIEDLDL